MPQPRIRGFSFKGKTMSLFIANTTKQDWHHHFRVLETNRPYYTQIPSGSQVELGKDWNAAQTDSVIRQLEKYGARHAVDVNKKIGKFHGLLYRTDKPITENQILTGHDAVVETQEKRSATEATRAVLGFEKSNRDKRSGKRLAKVTEVEIHQDIPRHQKPSKDDIHLKISVAEDGRDSVDVG